MHNSCFSREEKLISKIFKYLKRRKRTGLSKFDKISALLDSKITLVKVKI